MTARRGAGGKKAEKRRKREQNEATERVAVRDRVVGRGAPEQDSRRGKDRNRWSKGLRRREEDGWVLVQGVETEKKEYRSGVE